MMTAAGAAHRIVVGIDGSENSVAALQLAVRLAIALRRTVLAVQVWSYGPMYSADLPVLPEPELMRESAEAILQHTLREAFGPSKPEIVTTLVEQGYPSSVLVAESSGSEMLVVGARGTGGFLGLLMGSVASRCVEHAKCPVLVVRSA